MAQKMSLDLSDLPSEAQNPATTEFSRVSTLEALEMMNVEDQKVALAVQKVLPQVARAVDEIAPRLQNGGRLFYIGAGTSGRLGVVDASECPPTFGVSPDLVQGLIAGGKEAVFRSQEGAEDDREAGKTVLQSVHFSKNDCLVGLAASGRTPYILGALDYAREMGAFTAGISVNPGAILREYCEVFIAPEVGPEVVAGSTRLKAGTAQKLVLNMISTLVMARLGRVEGNLMTHLKPSCEKLEARARALVMNLAGVSAEIADLALEKSGGEVAAAVKNLAENNTSA